MTPKPQGDHAAWCRGLSRSLFSAPRWRAARAGRGRMVPCAISTRTTLFDRAVATFSESDMVAVARLGLLNRFPIGTPTAELRRYLRSIGGSCESKSGGPLICMYSQYFLWANRGIVGDEWREYRYHDFTIRVWPDRGPIARLTVCDAIVRETERGPMLLGNPHDRSRESAFKPCV